MRPVAPSLAWDLRLRPPALDRAYWLDRLARNKVYDTAVLLFWLIMLFCITPSWVSKLGWARYLKGYTPSWLMVVVWLAALRDISLYATYRTPVVIFGRVLMGLLAAQSTNEMRDTIWSVMVWDDRPVLTLLYKFLLLGNTFQLPIEAAALQLPFLLQVLLLAFRAACMLFTGCTKELIKFGNTPKYIAAADGMTSTWAAAIQSVLPLAVAPCARLADRSTAVFLSLTTLHVTTVTVTLYVVYISLWVDIRLWLQAKMNCIQERQHGDAAASSSSFSGAASDVVDVGGTLLSHEQLLVPYSTRAAAILLSSGATGRAVAACLHAVFVGVVCQVSLLLSQLFVLQLFPRLLSLPGAAALGEFDEFYPLAPAAGLVS